MRRTKVKNIWSATYQDTERHFKITNYLFDVVKQCEGPLSDTMIFVAKTSPYHDPLFYLMHKLGMR